VGKPRRIVLRTRTFDKVGDARAFFKEMLNRYPLGARLSDADAEDLEALLQRHEGLEEKVGCGIDHFEVREPPDDAPPFSARCFWIVRTDGSVIDISYPHCLEARPYD